METTILNHLNTNPEWVIVGAALLTNVIMYGVKKIRFIGKLMRYILSLVAIPGVLTVLASLATVIPTEYALIVSIVGQLTYATYEALKRKILESNAVLSETTTKTFLDEPAELPKATVAEY